MRILMLTQFLYPPTIGGEERHVADLCAELVVRGHEVAVVTLWQNGFPEFEIEQGVRIYRVRGSVHRMGMFFSESDRRYLPPFPDPEVLWSLRRIIQDEQPDIVHAHNWIVHSFIPLKTWSKAKLVVTLHDYSCVCVQKRLMRHGECCSGPGFTQCLECAAHFYGIVKGPPTALAHRLWSGKERQAVDMFLPVSRAVAVGNRLPQYKVPYRIIPNFILDNAEEIRDDDHPLLMQLPNEDFLLFVGDVMADKGAEILLRAYVELHTPLPLVLIGRPCLPGLNEHLPQNVLLLGSWPHDAVMSAWSRCLLGLVPSIVADSCPTVALEAMAVGKPLVASRIGGLSDIVVDGETGCLVPPGDSHALCEAIQCLLDNPEQRESMGKMSQQRVVQFQTKTVVPRIEQVYRDILQEVSEDSINMRDMRPLEQVRG